MPNVTLSIQRGILEAGREYAKRHNSSLNSLIRNLLARTVLKSRDLSRLQECFRLMDKAKGSSKRKKWRREDLYRV